MVDPVQDITINHKIFLVDPLQDITINARFCWLILYRTFQSTPFFCWLILYRMSQSTPDFFVCLWFSWQSICSLVFHCFLNGLMTIPLLHFMQSDLWNLLPVNQTVVCRFYEALCTVPKVQNHSYDSTESKYDLLTTSHQGLTAVGRSSSFSVCHHDTAVFHCSFLLLLISSHCVRHDGKPYISRDQWILKGWRGQYHDGIFDFPEHFQVLFLVLGWIDLRAWGKFLKNPDLTDDSSPWPGWQANMLVTVQLQLPSTSTQCIISHFCLTHRGSHITRKITPQTRWPIFCLLCHWGIGLRLSCENTISWHLLWILASLSLVTNFWLQFISSYYFFISIFLLPYGAEGLSNDTFNCYSQFVIYPADEFLLHLLIHWNLSFPGVPHYCFIAPQSSFLCRHLIIKFGNLFVIACVFCLPLLALI